MKELQEVMAEPILSNYMEKAQIESNLSITSNNINVKLCMEFLVELRKNMYHGMYNDDVVDHIAKGDGKITTWEELVEKLFYRFYPESYDGEDEMLDEGENWGIDPLEFLSNRYVDNNISSNNVWKESKYENPSNTATDLFFKAYDICDIEKENEQGQTNSKNNDKDDKQPNKRRCKEEKFEAIQYSIGPNEEYIAIRSYEYDYWEKNEDNLSIIYQDIFQKKDEGWKVTCTKE
ncbi:hypothetical protein Tco_0458413 [Tanacetum coccineum]